MKPNILSVWQTAAIVNGVSENASSCTPLYVGRFFSNCYQTALSFRLCNIRFNSAKPPFVTLSVYCNQITSNASGSTGFLHLGILNSGNAAQDIVAPISSVNENSYITFNLTELLKPYFQRRSRAVTILISPDSSLNYLCSFAAKNSPYPPYLAYSSSSDCISNCSSPCCKANCSPCNCKPDCCPPVLIPGPQGPAGPQGNPGTSGSLSTYAQIYNPNFTTSVSTAFVATRPVNYISLSNETVPNYTTGGFTISTTNGVTNDTLTFPQTGTYEITISLIFSFPIVDTATAGDGYLVIFVIQNEAATYNQNLLYEGSIPANDDGDSFSYQVNVSFLYNVTSLPDGISIGLTDFALNGTATSDPPTINVGNLIVDAVRIGPPVA